MSITTTEELRRKQAAYERLLKAARAMIYRLDWTVNVDTGSLSDVLVELRHAVRDCECEPSPPSPQSR